MSWIAGVLERPIAFHRAFVGLGAGVTGAVMLSQAIYWSKRTGEDGWFYKTQADWEDETGLTRREQETVRRKLVAAGVLQEERRGIPAKLFFRVNYDDLSAALGVQTSMAESANLERTEAPRQYGGKRQSIDSTETTAETTTETTSGGQKPAATKPAKAAAEDTETELQAACRATWAAYGQAYQRRYGAAPVRNASVNARIRQFVGRIGYDESPAVAAFFVDSITDAFVLRKLHEVGLLLSGAEGYRTQWVAGHAIAQTSAAPNRQEAQEARNRAVGEQWLRDMQAQQPQESRNA